MAHVKTEAEMFPLVESWQKSGLTQKAFSQKHQLTNQVFCYWIARYRKAQAVKPAVKTTAQPPLTTRDGEAAGAFIRFPTPAAAVCSAASATTVVELPAGVVLRFTGLVPAIYLKELLTCLPV